MKKVARMRLSPNSINDEMVTNQYSSGHRSNSEPLVRTTGRIKKPKAVFDPSDNYLPRAQRSLISGTNSSFTYHGTTSSSLERLASTTKSTTIPPVVPTDSKDACVVCKKKISKRPSFAIKNPLIACQECQRKIHKHCLKVDYEDFESLQRKYRCYQCSTCRICNDKFAKTEEEIIACSKCTKCFHLECFPTKIIPTDNLRNWKCNKCQVYNQITNGTTLPVKKIREIIGGGEPSSSAITNQEKSANSTIEKFNENSKNETRPSSISSPPRKNTDVEQYSSDGLQKIEETETEDSSPMSVKRKKANQSPDTIIAETVSLNTPSKSESTAFCYTPNEAFDDIPDVKEWSVDQVYDYFNKYFPKEAHVFKNEEIDGRSLLLLKRSDVVKKLAIKLGPSLRIYSLILKIQAQINDPTLGWNCGL